MIIERILKYPGFLYELKGSHYFLGKWICKECTDTDAADCVFMYRMSRRAKENAETSMYFQKIRAYADFALEVPYNPAKINGDMTTLLENLSDSEISSFSDCFCAQTNMRESCAVAYFTAVSEIILPTSKLTVVSGKITLPRIASNGSCIKLPIFFSVIRIKIMRQTP